MTHVLLDQGLPRSAATLLRAAGWQAEHVGECGLAQATDAQILAHARNHQFVVCTLDADFHAMVVLSGDSGPSVIRIRREGLRGSALAQLLIDLWPRIAPSLRHGALVSVTDRALRIRRLPVSATNPT